MKEKTTIFGWKDMLSFVSIIVAGASAFFAYSVGDKQNRILSESVRTQQISWLSPGSIHNARTRFKLTGNNRTAWDSGLIDSIGEIGLDVWIEADMYFVNRTAIPLRIGGYLAGERHSSDMVLWKNLTTQIENAAAASANYTSKIVSKTVYSTTHKKCAKS